MTAEADLIEDRRRQFATPGGFHDKLVGFLAKALPAAIGVIAAVMILSPLSPRGEIGFLLDRNKVAVTSERIAVDDAQYRGQDNRSRDFSVSAGQAVQASAANPVVEMRDLRARLQLSDGSAELWAPEGLYNYRSETISVVGPVNFRASDGWRMVTQNVDIDLKEQRATGSGGVSGAVPTGTFRAEQIVADLDAREVVLQGGARLRMVPGKLRIPQ